MDAPRRRYAMCNKPVIKEQIFHLHEVPGIIKFMEIGGRMEVVRDLGEGRMGSQYIRGSFSAEEDEQVMEMGGGKCCMTV